MKPLFPLWLLSVVCIVLLSGCGGGGLAGSSALTPQNSSRAGQVTLSVQWPPRTRLIPAAANSIQVALTQGATSLSTKLLARPVSGNTSSVSFNNLAPGDLTLTAVAYPNADGSGTAQAQGSSAVTVIAGQTTPVTVNMVSAISALTLTPNPLTIGGSGQTYPLTVTAKDSANNVVLLTPGKLNWSTNNAAAATVVNGVVTGLGTGSAMITVMDQESGKSASATVNSVQPISWWKAENNALDTEGANNGTTSGGVTYGPGKSGQGFIFNGTNGVVNLGDPNDLKFTGSFTIDCWVQTYAIPSVTQVGEEIFFRGDDRSGLDPYYLAINSDGMYHFQIDQDLNNATDITAPVTLGALQHITCTLDGTTGDMRLYVNGQVMAETTTSVRPFQNLDPSYIGGVAIGNHAGAPASIHNIPFNGIIDEVKVYNAVVPPLN